MERKEAIEVIKKNWPDSSFTMLREALETLIPELKESEDERIREDIISCLKYSGIKPDRPINPHVRTTMKDAIAWLEKQGDKVSAIESFETEFERQVSHLIASAINREHEYNEGYVKWTANALLNFAKHELKKQGEQKPLFPDNEVRDIWEYIAKFKTHYGHYPNNADEIEVIVREVINKRIKSKIEWNKRDEEILDTIISVFTHRYADDNEDERDISSWEIVRWAEKLKSRKLKSEWKPSGEQMDALKSSTYCQDKKMSKVLFELYQDLLKLKE